MKLTAEDVQRILRVVDELEYGEIRLVVGELKLHVRKDRPGDAAVAPMGASEALVSIKNAR